MELQNGTVKAIFYSQKSNPLYRNPVLQIISLGELNIGSDDKRRYKSNLSDGANYMKAVFSSELAQMFEGGEITKYSFIELDKFDVNIKDNNSYLYVRSISGHERQPAIIGEPVNIASGVASIEPGSQQKANLNSFTNEKNKENQAAVGGGYNPTGANTSDRFARNTNDTQKRAKIDEDIVEIKRIFPHKKNMKFRGRVVSKSELKKFTTQKGEGKIFSFEIADSTGQIKCVAFSETADAFFPVIEADKVYTISNVMVKPANKKYSSNASDFEIHLDMNSLVQSSSDSDAPKYAFKFIKVADLASVGGVVDCIGIIKEVYPVSKVMIKSTGKENSKRDLHVVDQTGACRLTIWGPKSEEEYEKDTIICVRSVKVQEYNGINLSTTANTQIITGSDLPESVELLAWYETTGKSLIIDKPKKATRRSLISEVKDNSLEYATIQASVMYIKENGMFYEACPGENCNKKVSSENNGTFRCEKCNYTFDKCNYRYMVSMHVGDFTGQMWITLFDDSAKSMFGVSAEEMKQMNERNPEEVYSLVRGAMSREFVLRIKNREENYNGDIKLRSNCLELTGVDCVVEMKRLLDVIEKIEF